MLAPPNRRGQVLPQRLMLAPPNRRGQLLPQRLC